MADVRKTVTGTALIILTILFLTAFILMIVSGIGIVRENIIRR